MLNRKQRLLLKKIVSLFSVVRGYNIPVIILAQYLSAIFILAPEKRALEILFDIDLFLLVFASAITIASGYIINNFYDSRKDLINRPNKSMLDRLISQATKLKVYFGLNFLAAALALLVSWKVFLFFSIYIFMIWFYSHKIKKYAVVGNLTATMMAVIPFFAITLHYYYNLSFEEIISHKSQFAVIFSHATFLSLLLLIREMIKDLENIKGDLANDYRTIPIRYGESMSKKIITLLVFLTILPVYLLVGIYEVGYMDIYFYASFIILILFLVYLWRASTKEQYLLLHNVLKFLIVSGVFCIVLIDPSVLYNGKRWILAS
ncbi:geranylgeranylglycerol-phosphate geranylgeranyltransferase [Flavobacterium algicola]|uniref:geranylgeranylglycerol-phosphate geranylgeranyltransferase n=1 Tax=Flavobacterium algicola TaxID=556529 RepID=UPI001EFDC12E|nr:geranylgeranylglycerol-phosphate geranylgeranyltransferase [Flavobacterium algicola]MCG9794102.1 geranylgeranylglycerol-phosphate geranylgeranyltransferase [Flavobacterium algicola]